MRPLQTDLSIYGKFNFERPPVGVKFLFSKPEGIEPLGLDKNLSFCDFLVEAQKTGNPFYFGNENNETCVGKFLLGMEDMEPFAESGQIGAALKIFQEPRANYIFYQYVPRFKRGIVNYVAFSPIAKLTFEPDLLIISAKDSQAEIVMRAMTYSTGELYNSRSTPVMGCAWLYIYPYQSGKVNFIVPNMIHGMDGRELYSEGTILISIPYHWIPIITQNLKEIDWNPPSHQGREKFLSEFQKVMSKLIP